MKRDKAKDMQLPALEDRLPFYEQIRTLRGNCSEEDFKKAIRLQAKWDMTHAKSFEKLIKRPFNLGEFKRWYDKAVPLWKKLQAAHGRKICKAYGCLAIVSDAKRKDAAYCRKKCRNNARQKKWSDSHIVEKKLRRP